MKLATIPAIVAFGIASLCAYALYTFSPLSDVKLALSLIAGLVLFITLLFTVAVQTNYERTTMNVRFLSGVFFVGLLVLNGVFSFLFQRLAPSIIVNGIIVLLFLLITNGIVKAKQ